LANKGGAAQISTAMRVLAEIIDQRRFAASHIQPSNRRASSRTIRKLDKIPSRSLQPTIQIHKYEIKPPFTTDCQSIAISADNACHVEISSLINSGVAQVSEVTAPGYLATVRDIADRCIMLAGYRLAGLINSYRRKLKF
jgi:hypothetical protein